MPVKVGLGKGEERENQISVGSVGDFPWEFIARGDAEARSDVFNNTPELLGSSLALLMGSLPWRTLYYAPKDVGRDYAGAFLGTVYAQVFPAQLGLSY